MPVPWDIELLEPGVRGTKRPAQDNGITLQQLRELGTFVRRLCKMGLLKQTVVYNRSSDDLGHPIKWAQVNMHNINDEVVKKLIPQSDSCSWVEIVTREPQKSRYFVSHNWAEPFRDFCHSIEMFSANNACRDDDVFFVCTFANDQWNLDLGTSLVTSPFYEALKCSENMIFALDKQASALSRLWCIFEVTTAMDLDKSLSITTPLGLIGDRRLSSGSVIEALTHVDVRKATASNPADARQILNYIAKVGEMQGLTIVSGDCAHKSIMDTFGPYEERLLREHEEKFQSVNQKLQKHASLLRTNSMCGCTVPKVGDRAMTLAQLRMMAMCAKEHFRSSEDNTAGSWDSVTILDLLGYFKMEYEKHGKNSYMETIAPGPQKPQFVVNCTFVVTVVDMMAAIEWHAEARQLPDSATYWLMGTATNKEEGDAYMAANLRTVTCEAMEFARGMLIVLDGDAKLLSRALPASENVEAFKRKLQVDIACPTGAIATMRPFQEGWEFGSFDPKIADILMLFDVMNISGAVDSNADHKQLALCRVAQVSYSMGDQAPVMSEHYDSFNRRLRWAGLGPALREAAASGHVDKVQTLLHEHPRAVIYNHLGGRALRSAAAGGHDDIVKLLLARRVDPDLQDEDGETPLHYAAVSGNASTVAVLLQQNASHELESYYGETPAEVACQNAAFFLGVNTRRVMEVLSGLKSRGPTLELSNSAAQEPYHAFEGSKTCALM